MAEDTQLKQKKISSISWIVFFFTGTIVLISLVSVIFPALIVRTMSSILESQVEPFELGVWATPLIVANLIILGIGLGYSKKKLPNQISNSIKFIFDFEVSKRIAIIVMIVFLGIYITSSAQELASEEIWGDYAEVKNRVDNWSIEQVGGEFEPHFRYFLLSSSLAIFDNIRIIPFLASISLIILTYLFTLQISQKRFAGLVASAVLLQSSVFWSYDTTATYENFWITLYLLSLYLVYKSWPLSPVSYILSILSKALTALFLPMTIFFIYRANISKQKKKKLVISYLIVLAIGIGVSIAYSEGVIENSIEFSNLAFWQGFTSMAFQIRFDVVVLLFLLPVTVGLFLASRKGIIQAESIMILISGILLSAPILTGFTDITNQPYRFVPLIVFFAIGIGVILSKRKNIIKQV